MLILNQNIHVTWSALLTKTMYNGNDPTLAGAQENKKRKNAEWYNLINLAPTTLLAYFEVSLEKPHN